MKVCQNAPSVSHLLFADDSLILIRATEGDAKQLQDILDLFGECCSCQMIKKAKSAVLFSRNTNAQRSRRCVLQITKETMNERYLGLPAQVGKSKSKTFA